MKDRAAAGELHRPLCLRVPVDVVALWRMARSNDEDVVIQPAQRPNSRPVISANS